MSRTRSSELKALNSVVAAAVKNFRPPEDLTVTEWAEKYRRLSPENSAEAGPWRTDRTPYLREIMDAFTDPKIRRLVVVASSQVGKSEMELNMLGYLIDSDPGPTLFILPTVDVAQDFSKRRISSMIRDCRRLRRKVADAKSRDGNNTVLKKQFPGGMLTITGANSPSSLASIPARYVFGDERDRWPLSAGAEGDPWGLAEARTTTFYNSKMVEVSTPTIKGASAIEASYEIGTRERWCHQCPECGEFHNIVFNNIKFDFKTNKIKGKKIYKVKAVWWECPSCGHAATEGIMKKQPAKWIAENPDAYHQGVRSFWINGFASPWMSWDRIVLRFLQAKDDPHKLKVVYNTILGELWEDRGDLEDEDSFLARREEYPAELPDGVLVLTCGVDTQDNRIEYEVVGHGHYGETWGIKKGFIMGRPDNPEVWERLDDVIDRTYRFKDGKGLKISMTCVDSGGHYTQEVYEACRARQHKRVFAIKGRGGDGVPYVAPPTKVPIRQNKRITCWLYTIGVDAGKSLIMSSLKVQEPGPKYCHFPRGEDRGYDALFFNGLLSERLVLKRSRGRDRWMWEKIPGHNRNEALDCRNYAMAAFRILNPDLEAVEKRLAGIQEKPQLTRKPAKPKRMRSNYYDDW
mgnify:FL=1